jgi:hypothetical protein
MGWQIELRSDEEAKEGKALQKRRVSVHNCILFAASLISQRIWFC